MKKILFAIPLFAMLLVACDPIVDEISPDPNVTPENLTFELVAKNQGNNNIQIVPTPSRYVKVYDATSDIKLAEGTAPSVQVAPPNKELQVYVTTINSDGSITKSASKSIAVTEYTDLPAIYADVFGTTPDGGYGTTTWVWNTEETVVGVMEVISAIPAPVGGFVMLWEMSETVEGKLMNKL